MGSIYLGNPKAMYLVVTEQGTDTGMPISDVEGKLLVNVFKSFGLDVFNDCGITCLFSELGITPSKTNLLTSKAYSDFLDVVIEAIPIRVFVFSSLLERFIKEDTLSLPLSVDARKRNPAPVFTVPCTVLPTTVKLLSDIKLDVTGAKSQAYNLLASALH